MTRSAASAVVAVLLLAGCAGGTVDGSGSAGVSAPGVGTDTGSGQVSLVPPTVPAPSPTPSAGSSVLSGPELQAKPPLPSGGGRTTGASQSSGTTSYTVPLSFDATRAFYAREIPALGLRLSSPAISRGLHNEVLSYHYVISTPGVVPDGAHGSMSIYRFFNRAFLPKNRTVVDFALS